MSDRLTFNPARLAERFSAVQPAQDPVQSARAATPPCCLQTTLQVSTANADRRCELRIPARGAGGSVLQMLAMSEGADGAALFIHAAGPAECPPGLPNKVHVQEGQRMLLKRQVPFERWKLPLQTALDFSTLAKDSAALLTTAHPFQVDRLASTVCLISVPGCRSVALQASIAVYPDVRWEGGIHARTLPDASSLKEYRVEWESTVRGWCGEHEWRPQTWEDALLWCPWLGVLDALARSLASISTLGLGSRDRGLDNAALAKAGPLKWEWPQLHASIQSSLFESPDSPLLGSRLEFHGAADPGLAASGEMSLLPHWLESSLRALWLERLAPLRIGLANPQETALAHEIGIWLVAEGRMRWRLSRQTGQPHIPPRSSAESHGQISLRIDGRTTRDYETIVVCAGSARMTGEPAGFSAACVAPEPAAVPGSQEDCFQARVAFTGIAVRAVEKLRPGIRLRRLASPTLSADARSTAAPLAMLFSPRVWPPEAGEQPAPIPWVPS